MPMASTLLSFSLAVPRTITVISILILLLLEPTVAVISFTETDPFLVNRFSEAETVLVLSVSLSKELSILLRNSMMGIPSSDARDTESAKAPVRYLADPIRLVLILTPVSEFANVISVSI